MKVFGGMLCFLFVLSLNVKAQDSVRVALVQAHLIWGDVKSNLWAFDKRVPLCKGADVIVFPELFTSGCEMKKRDKEEAIRSKDEVASYYPTVIKRMKKWARRSGALVIGSTIYKEEGKYYNRLLAVYPDEDKEEWERHLPDFPKEWINGYDKKLVIKEKNLYDLKAIPTLYLLDKDKKVLLKDATVAQIDQYLQ